MHFQPINNNQQIPDVEKEILKFWLEEKIFDQAIDLRKNGKKYVFFDGPPFANGLPHYGHILASSIKDAVTRYFSMRGFHVPRTNGWDCHGLPVEYEIEKELELSGKKDIEALGVDKFNDACRESVFRYTKEWQVLLERIARWVDFENTYATLDNTYMESIWWVFRQIWDKNLVYQDYRSMHICPRCETPLSNFEVSLGYKDVTDLSATAKFKLLDSNHENTYLLAWTTTPWTLPANMALCLGPKIAYSRIRQNNEIYIVAQNLIDQVFAEAEYEYLGEISPQELENKSYEPLFDYYANEPDKKRFIITLDDYVTTEDGTGIVHIAGGYGAEDFAVSKRYNLDIIVHTDVSGKFLPEVHDFADKFVKNQESNIVSLLESKGKLFHKENYRHSYPHCWRCDTPLLNHSLKSWYIRVTDIKDKMLANNQKINWQPAHVKEGRFGKWLENARDWNISRNRFWGAPIPIWECNGCQHQTCVSSIRELRIRSKNGNTLYFVRHGEAEHNIEHITNTDTDSKSDLTTKGKEQAQQVAEKLKNFPVTRIISSPFARTEQTASIIAEALNKELTFDERLREFRVPNNTSLDEINQFFSQAEDLHSAKMAPDNENLKEVQTRLEAFLDHLGNEYQNEHIVCVTHGAVIGLAQAYFEEQERNLDWMRNLAHIPQDSFLTYQAGKVPMRGSELDLHKPYIDDIKFACDNCENGEMQRIPEVLDCWFESGAMPYAKPHYPFEDKKDFEENFPAQFIAEGLDQTRGWFYTLHVLSTILFDKPAFENIIVNGILLAKNGEKLSKRKRNYPDPNILFDTKGVDATRLFMYQSTAPQAEDVRFSEDHVDEVFKKFNLTLWNTYSFFVTYANIDNFTPPTPSELAEFQPQNELDIWILSELNALIAEVTTQMEAYNLTKATRPLTEFVDQLSNWYIRRSRRRFWKSESDSDKQEAYQTLYLVLTAFCKVIAPFTPFIADAIYKNLTKLDSVHFADWPEVDKKRLNADLNEVTNTIREIVSLGHTIRGQQKIKVRQPLALVEVAIADAKLKAKISNQTEVILEELNIKELNLATDLGDKVKPVLKINAKLIGPKFGKEVQTIINEAKAGNFQILESGQAQILDFLIEPEEFELAFEAKPGLAAAAKDGIVVILHTEISEELKYEGFARDIVRQIQDLRKEADYQVSDRITIMLKTDNPELETAILNFADYIKTETLATELQQSGDMDYDKSTTTKLEGIEIQIAIRKS